MIENTIPLRIGERRHYNRPDQASADGMIRYRGSKMDCDACALKPRCCPTQDARKVPRSVHAGARELARSLRAEGE